MDDFPNSSFFGALKERLGVGDGLIEGGAIIFKANIVGIEKAVSASQMIRQSRRVIKVIMKCPHLFTEGIRLIGVGGNSADPLPAVQQLASDVAPNISKRAGYHVESWFAAHSRPIHRLAPAPSPTGW